MKDLLIHGTGIDTVEICRIERLVKRWGERFINRVFAPAEREYCDSGARRFARYAARFAAKEAVGKAMGTGIRGMRWKDIVIDRADLGRPVVRLSGTAQKRAERLGISRWHVSLSHGRRQAVAQVLALKNGE